MLKLIQGYYHFLALGKFMEGLILSNDLSTIAMDYPIKTWEKSSFLLKESLLKNLLSSLNSHPDQRNIYGYLTEISAFKGIFSTIRELIETSLPFRNFLKHQLQEQYFPFEQTIRFLRNVLNHATTGNLLIKLEDYDIQKDYILSPKIQRVNNLKGSALIKFDFTYINYIKERKGSSEYGISFSIDFAKLRPWIPLEKLISRHNLYLLAELCFNLSQIAQYQYASQKPQKPTPIKKEKNTRTIKIQKKSPSKKEKSDSRG